MAAVVSRLPRPGPGAEKKAVTRDCVKKAVTRDCVTSKELRERRRRFRDARSRRKTKQMVKSEKVTKQEVKREKVTEHEESKRSRIRVSIDEENKYEVEGRSDEQLRLQIQFYKFLESRNFEAATKLVESKESKELWAELFVGNRTNRLALMVQTLLPEYEWSYHGRSVRTKDTMVDIKNVEPTAKFLLWLANYINTRTDGWRVLVEDANRRDYYPSAACFPYVPRDFLHLTKSCERFFDDNDLCLAIVMAFPFEYAITLPALMKISVDASVLYQVLTLRKDWTTEQHMEYVSLFTRYGSTRDLRGHSNICSLVPMMETPEEQQFMFWWCEENYYDEEARRSSLCHWIERYGESLTEVGWPCWDKAKTGRISTYPKFLEWLAAEESLLGAPRKSIYQLLVEKRYITYYHLFMDSLRRALGCNLIRKEKPKDMKEFRTSKIVENHATRLGRELVILSRLDSLPMVGHYQHWYYALRSAIERCDNVDMSYLMRPEVISTCFYSYNRGPRNVEDLMNDEAASNLTFHKSKLVQLWNIWQTVDSSVFFQEYRSLSKSQYLEVARQLIQPCLPLFQVLAPITKDNWMDLMSEYGIRELVSNMEKPDDYRVESTRGGANMNMIVVLEYLTSPTGANIEPLAEAFKNPRLWIQNLERGRKKKEFQKAWNTLCDGLEVVATNLEKYQRVDEKGEEVEEKGEEVEEKEQEVEEKGEVEKKEERQVFLMTSKQRLTVDKLMKKAADFGIANDGGYHSYWSDDDDEYSEEDDEYDEEYEGKEKIEDELKSEETWEKKMKREISKTRPCPIFRSDDRYDLDSRSKKYEGRTVYYFKMSDSEMYRYHDYYDYYNEW